ncbi:VanZ family protein [Streptomyces sp. SHP 1-2]|uniref:VanZ family protein n=1 Tax=Streptomyces sp. SHP 1-2 TaxID=2769489 RepID=UPI0022390B71|nr:VanZ family protein [Streptomyces sp. SHP 1-2]MCW5251833.1 VanZ family protein [Streptomyces sp. SHP 1-2]
MIQAVFNGNQGMLVTAVTLSMIAALMSYFLGRRLGKPGIPCALTGAALATVVSATLYPISPDAPASATCFIERNIATETFTAQGLLNVLLFIPLAALATWLTRRPIPVALTCVALSATIEVVQALTPGMGRACDSTDLWTNSLGAFAGALIVGAGLHWEATRGGRDTVILISRHQVRRSLIGFASGIAVLGLISAFTVTFVMAEVASANAASPEQRETARRAITDFLGEQARATSVQFFPGPAGGPGRISANTDRGVLDIEWPSREVTSGLLRPISPAVGPGTAPVSDDAALRAGTAFVRDHFPWALAGDTDVSAAGPQQASKLVSWRSRENGVLMPMRMDVLVGPDLKITSFTARHIPDPELPSVRIGRQQAQTIATHKFPGDIVHSGELLARTDGIGRWHPYWMLSVGPPGADTAPSQDGVAQDGPPDEDFSQSTSAPAIRVITLDAVTGDVVTTRSDSVEAG